MITYFFKMKKRKIETPKSHQCDICYQDSETIVECFKGCTINTCEDCLEKQIKIQSNRVVFDQPNNFTISYTCSMCQHKSRYAQDSPEDVKFTEWIRNSPKVLTNLLDKFIGTPIPTNRNSTYALLATIGDEDDFLNTIFDSYIPPASLLPWPYRLIPPPWGTIGASGQTMERRNDEDSETNAQDPDGT